MPRDRHGNATDAVVRADVGDCVVESGSDIRRRRGSRVCSCRDGAFGVTGNAASPVTAERTRQMFGAITARGRGAAQLMTLLLCTVVTGGHVLADHQYETDHQLAMPNPVDDERFGTAMAIEGTTAVIGAPGQVFGESAWPGRVLVYELTTDGWVYVATLSWADGVHGDAFGCSVDIDGDRIAVGIRNGHDHRGVMTGLVAIFHRLPGGWSSTDQPDVILSPLGGRDEDAFGATVMLQDDTLVVGAPGVDTINEDAGAAYVFTHDGQSWNERQTLLSTTDQHKQHFGLSIALEDDHLAIGAPNVGAHDDPGSVHCFLRNGSNTWDRIQVFDDRVDEQDGDHFGRAIAFAFDPTLNDRWMIVGSSGRNTHTGEMNAYRLNGDGTQWIHEQVIVADDLTNGDHFGFSISVDGDMLVVGATRGEVGETRRAGAAYRFDCNGNGRWVQRARVFLADSQPDASFGYAVNAYLNPFTGEPGALISACNFGGSQGGDGGIVDAAGVVAIVEPSSVSRQQ